MNRFAKAMILFVIAFHVVLFVVEALLWMQPGVGSYVAAQRARDAGLKVVLNHCMATELHKLHALVAE